MCYKDTHKNFINQMENNHYNWRKVFQENKYHKIH